MVIPIRFLLIFLLAAFSFLPSKAQDTLMNQTDPSGRKQGFWRKTTADGHKVYEGTFENNIPTGEFRYYYPDGKLKTVSFFYDTGRKARTVSYYKNGRIMAKGNYAEEKKDSTWQFFNEFDGTLTQTEEYRDGKRNGISKTYISSGTMVELVTFKDDEKDGPWEQYYPDGKPMLKSAFSAGDNYGDYRAWYPDGQLMTSGQYREGHRDGTWLYFDEKGKREKTEIYREGKLITVDEAR